MLRFLGYGALALWVCACASEAGEASGQDGLQGAGAGGEAGQLGAAGGLPSAGAGQSGDGVPEGWQAVQAGHGGASGQPLAGVGADVAAGEGAPPVAGMGDEPAGTGGMQAPEQVSGAGGMQATPPLGPEDGDPSAPVISVPNVRCGPNPSLFGLTSTNVQIGGRGVHVAYPCNKRKGAPVVFILNLHGTMPSEDLKLYQVAYFAANNLVDSHNFITAAPKAVGSQWGNGDGGADLPHLMAVIDWVYTTFADFDIRAMWVAGHSWGCMYTTTFACRAELASKVRGVVLQSGTGQNPACAAKLSVISSAAESDIGPVVNQGGVPASHGCGAPQESRVGNNVETYWPNCSPGFAHANYLMLGKGHSDYMDAEVVRRIGDLIKGARP